jgi:hypothetical protein
MNVLIEIMPKCNAMNQKIKSIINYNDDYIIITDNNVKIKICVKNIYSVYYDNHDKKLYFDVSEFIYDKTKIYHKIFIVNTNNKKLYYFLHERKPYIFSKHICNLVNYFQKYNIWFLYILNIIIYMIPIISILFNMLYICRDLYFTKYIFEYLKPLFDNNIQNYTTLLVGNKYFYNFASFMYGKPKNYIICDINYISNLILKLYHYEPIFICKKYIIINIIIIFIIGATSLINFNLHQ